MKKRSILSFLVCSALVLFVFISCGIPRMFPWRDTYQYNIDSDSIDFKLRFKTSGSDEYWPKLIPSPNTPILRFYYLIVPEASMQSTVSGIVSSFSSRYSSSFPKSFGSGEAAYTSSYETTSTDDETISVSLYELSIIHDNGRFEPVSQYFQGIDWFEPMLQEGEELPSDGYADEYQVTYSFAQESIEGSNEYYITLTLNGETYRLGRSNGEPFVRDARSYYDDDDSEFLPEDSDGLLTDAKLLIYATASFAFEGYTTRQTIRMDKNRTSYDQPLI